MQQQVHSRATTGDPAPYFIWTHSRCTAPSMSLAFRSNFWMSSGCDLGFCALHTGWGRGGDRPVTGALETWC